MDRSVWRSVVDKVQPHIPSIEANSSWCEDEGDVNIEIFQRPPGLSLKLPDESDEDDILMDNCILKDSLKVIVPESSTVELNKQKYDTNLKSNEKSTKYTPTNGLVLSFARLEKLDCNVFENTQERIKTQHATNEIKSEFEDGNKHDYNNNIMDKIAAYCEMQSLNCKDPNYVKKNYMGGKLEENTVEESNIQECPTIYIDLRCHDQETKSSTCQHVKLVCKETSPAKRNSPPHMETQTNGWNETGKSMLIRKIRENNSNNKKDSIANSKREELHGKPLQFKVPTDCDLCKLPASQQHLCLNSEHTKPKMKGQNINQHTTKKQRDKSRDQKQYQHFVMDLEKGRSTKSVRQKQAAAEKTDLLYDIEASHLEPIITLPTDTENKGRMLLIVSLSSPGVVEDRVYGKRKNTDSAVTKSHIYNTLVAWLFSLVGPNSLSNNESNAKVPFWVAGLQQLWTENGLALHVLAVAKNTYTQRRKDSDIHCPFYNHVSRFLSETSLPAIAHWLPQLNNMIDRDAYSSPICLPSYNLNAFITTTTNKKVMSKIFSFTPGFYWQTLETPEHVCKGRETTQELHTEVSVALGCKNFFELPLVTHYTLQSVLHSGLDVCGLRLLYPEPALLGDCFGLSNCQRGQDTQPVLGMAVRGPYAHSLLKAINKSVDKIFRKKNTVMGAPPFLYTPEEQGQVHREMCLWFSGRLMKESGNDQKQPIKSEVQVASEDATFLCATTKADVLLVVSPLVPTCCYGQVLATCERRGFMLRGLQRLHIQNYGASLGLTSQQAQIYSRNCHCLVLILRKENAQHHSITLPAALMRDLESQNFLTCLHSMGDVVQTIMPSFCFHTVPYSNNMYNNFARSAWTTPDPSTVVLSSQECPLDLETEQAVVLTLCGQDMSQGLGLLHRALTQHGFELLGLKWLPGLSQLQAQEVSPYEVGEKYCHQSVASLMSSPALVCALRRADAFALLRNLLPNDCYDRFGVLMSPTPQVASRQTSLFFFDDDIIPNPPMLFTVCLFKPGVWNKDFGKIVRTLRLTGLMLVGLRVIVLSKSDAAALLTSANDLDSGDHVEYLYSGSSLAVCLQGENAVRRLLDVLSSCELFSGISGHNGLHLYNEIYAPETYEKAVQDVKRLFPEGLCCVETRTMRKEQIPSLYAEHLSVDREPKFTSDTDLSSFTALGSNEESLIPSVPWQTACVLLPVHVPLLSHCPSQLDVLQELLVRGCHLVEGRMTLVTKKRWAQITKMLECCSSENEKASLLVCSLIVAIEGDSFDSVLESIYRDKSEMEKLGRAIIYSKSQTPHVPSVPLLLYG